LKRFISILIKIGIPLAVIYAAYSTNPTPDTHRSAIVAKEQAFQEKDILGQADRMMYGRTGREKTETPFRYHDYVVCSKVTGPENETVSYGFFNRVFVTKTEF
jgi:hypothetical protein